MKNDEDTYKHSKQEMGWKSRWLGNRMSSKVSKPCTLKHGSKLSSLE